MRNTLEGSSLFPIIAWILVIGFAVFTWTLTVHLKGELAGISTGVDRIEARLDAQEGQ